MKLRILILLIAMCTAAVSCSREPVDEHLVVDGWIEDGGYPVVKLTSSIAVAEGALSSDDIAAHVLRWATVTVSDGEQTVFLTGMRDNRYFPPYVYTTYNMKGEAGKTYTLNVRYGKTEVSAEATIPEPQPLDTLYAEPASDGYVLRASFDAKADGRYIFFAQRDSLDSEYLLCQFSLVDGSTVKDKFEQVVYTGFSVRDVDYMLRYAPGEHVSVRFCNVDGPAFEFWRGYMDEWIFSRSPFFPVSASPMSNVTGGYGVWAGYGATYYEIDIPE